MRFPSLPPRVLLPLLGLLLGGTLRLAAQDVTFSPVQWTDPKDPPDVMPAIQGRPRVEFPPAFRSTPDVGYVVVSFALDPRGRRLGAMMSGSMPTLSRAVELALAEFKFSPGTREGKPVNTAIAVAVIFNPASAAPALADATPRLLEVSSVRIPRPEDARPSDRFEDRVIPLDVTVDEAGRIAGMKNAPPELAEEIAIAAKNWRFAPARRGGQPVASDIRVPFVIETAGRTEPGTRVPPRVTSQTAPNYPMAMRRSGLRGEVVVKFIVDIEGRVQTPQIVRSLNPTFDDPALEAVRKWRFEPGRIGERPVATLMQVPVMFQLNGVEDGGGDGMVERRKADLSKLPEAFRYDTPPRLMGMVRPVFPHALLTGGKRGKAVVRYIVGESGHVVQAQVLEATAPEFGEALRTAVEHFTYEPAAKGGRPSVALLGFEQVFDRDEAHQIVAVEDLALARREERQPGSIVPVADLDRPLKPLVRQPVRFPLSRIKDGQPGEAVVEFLIDYEGRARLPRVVSATHEAFGYAAVQSVATWRFEPPTRGGKPVTVRAQVPVRFALNPPPADAGAK